MKTLIKPPRLQAGDTVAAITLSWGGAGQFPERYALGKRRVEELLGLRVVETRHALRDPAWIAANPKARADDWMEALADPAIKGIFSIIGGDDSLRIWPHVDLDQIARHPKVFLGYSDTTVSHFMCLKAGVTSFYGASVLAEFAENVEPFAYTTDSVRKTLFSAEPVGLIQPASEWSGERLEWAVPENALIRRTRSPALLPRVLQGEGIVSGPLIGGCIEVLDWLRGTPLWPEDSAFDGAILFLETSEENPPPLSFKRMLRPFAAMGVFSRVAGVLLGRPMSAPDPAVMTQYDTELVKVIRDECGLSRLPIMTQLDFGHSSPQMVLPFGVRAEIDCARARFSLLEAGVV